MADMDSTPDAELVALARSGDKAAFGRLVERHQPVARRVAARVVADPELGRELAQEAVLQAYLSLDRLRDGHRFGSWLYGIVLNVCRSHLRDRKSDPFSLEAITGGMRFQALPFVVEPDPQEIAEAQELHRTVLASVDALSPKNRAATLMFYYEQLSVREIAATLGVSVAAVKTRLHRSREQLRETLLPATHDGRPQKAEVKKMIPVTIADVMVADEGKSKYMAVLFDQAGRRILPIWMGEPEGRAIAAGLKDFQFPRPMTHTFAARVLEAVGGRLEEVRIHELKGDTFYAVAKLRGGDAAGEVDARPSDALALAVLTGCQIYVAEEVMDKAGQSLPEELQEPQPQGKGIDDIVGAMAKNIAESHEDIVGYVFGGEADKQARD